MSNQLSFDEIEPDAFAEPHVRSTSIGWTSKQAQSLAGITYRQLDYWDRSKLVSPSLRAAAGSGSQRLYSYLDVILLRTVARILAIGVSLQSIRVAIDAIRERGLDDLAGVHLFSDGTTIFELTSNDEVIDLLQGGQGVFGIAVGKVWREVEGELASLPSERAEHDVAAAPRPGDELGARRAQRLA